MHLRCPLRCLSRVHGPQASIMLLQNLQDSTNCVAVALAPKRIEIVGFRCIALAFIGRYRLLAHHSLPHFVGGTGIVYVMPFVSIILATWVETCQLSFV